MRYVRAGKPLYVETPMWGDEAEGLVPSLTVDGPVRINTGLICADGTPIMRVQAPIGFGRDEEW